MTPLQVTQTIGKLYEVWAKQGIRFVVFECADRHGMLRSKIIPIAEWKHYPQHGVDMIGVMITVETATNIVSGTYLSSERYYGDAILRPDLSTAQIMPCREKTARMICDLSWPDGTPLQSARVTSCAGCSCNSWNKEQLTSMHSRWSLQDQLRLLAADLSCERQVHITIHRLRKEDVRRRFRETLVRVQGASGDEVTAGRL